MNYSKYKLLIRRTGAAGLAGALTFGTSLLLGMLMRTEEALLGSVVKGEDPNAGMVGAEAGLLIDYKVGDSLGKALNTKLNQ
ncbi:hypothetical protein KQH49_07240 [Mycetohabitans sp. B5]|uniref:hypothetical protein n=1 Tax=Mycetohabitans TaxID=2571159 RepID=UPI0011B0238A|nr:MULTISPECIES: hypothetical protein [Mycetohabitans]MCG1054761.1 hypothetical protein [Mycetohabitans sp. B5]